MTYSQLINRREETSKRSTRDGRTVERIVVHHWAGIYGGVERLVYSSDQASANYIILNDGALIGSVPEEYAAWTSGSWEVDSRSVTVEVQNETTAPEWRVSQAAINTLIQLIIDLGRRYNWGTIDRTRVRGHQEFYATSCPGPYLYPKLGEIAYQANVQLQGGSIIIEKPKVTDRSVKCVDRDHVNVKELQQRLTDLGWYDREIDGIDGDGTRIAIVAYQRNQRYFPNLLADGFWGELTEAHYQWVKTVQEAMNDWQTAERMGEVLVDGSFGNYSFQLARQIQIDNQLGAYTDAVKTVYGSDAIAVADGIPGKAFCKMLGIEEHPTS